MFVHSLALLALLASCQGRAVNISNTWVLPEEGFPVFYRYFRDRISWYEADAVCQFHHANLVTVDTTAQYDAVRAYLKELDISSAVWVGLIRSNPDGDFTWTDYRGLSGEGYWSAAPDARAAPLCAAADPSADYRWEARACGGPTVASFICELPVPQWALGNEGCMVRALPALTILYLPESAAVQLTADCGLAGVKKVQCTGNVKREDLLKELSCNEEEDLPSTLNPTSDGTTWVTTDIASNSSDFETTTETSINEDATVSEHTDTNTQNVTEATTTSVNVQTKQTPVFNKLSNIYTQKNVNLDLIRENNFQSNDIPKLAHNENILTIEESEKLEDEKHMHHKLLHDEMAKHGNFETIFTQPTDHFVPPLVMAKAKISDDMTVLSLAEKHAQQLAEQRYTHLKVLDEHKEHIFLSKNVVRTTTEEPHKFDIFEQPLVMTLQPVNAKDELKKDKIKSSLPKKYKEKHEDPKSKYLKLDGKLMKFDKTTEKPQTSLDISNKNLEISTIPVTKSSILKADEYNMELTVILKEPTKESHKTVNNTINGNETSTTENKITISTVTTKTPDIDETMSPIPNKDLMVSDGIKKLTSAPLYVLNTEEAITETSSKINVDAMKDVTMNHEIIKITIINDDDKYNSTSTVFEVTTLMPEFKDAVKDDNKTIPFGIYIKDMVFSEKAVENSANVTDNPLPTTPKLVDVTSIVDKSFASTSTNSVTKDSPRQQNEKSNTDISTTTETHGATPTATPTPQSIKTTATAKPTELSTTPNLFYTTKEKHDALNVTETYEELENSSIDSEAIDDLNSPLLSGANEPIHRPNRSRRPQPPNKLSKFNPFRILG